VASPFEPRLGPGGGSASNRTINSLANFDGNRYTLAMAENVIFLAEWKAKQQTKMWVWYPVERDPTQPLGWRFELVEAMPLEPKVDPLDC
jgi:hypothetical protein